jgi:hypothetical protein
MMPPPTARILRRVAALQLQKERPWQIRRLTYIVTIAGLYQFQMNIAVVPLRHDAVNALHF